MNDFQIYYKNQYDKAVKAIEESRVTEALMILNNLEFLGIKDSKILNLKGFCYYLSCDFLSARNCFNYSLTLDYSEDTKEYIEKLDSEEFKVLENYYNQGLIEIEKKNYIKAKEYLEILKEKEFCFIGVYKWLFLIYNELGNKKLAFENINKALELDQSNFEIVKWFENENKYRLKKFEILKKLFIITLIFLIFSIFIILFN